MFSQLHAEGAQSFRIHVTSHLWAESILCANVKAIWENFDHNGEVVEAMITNVVRNWVGGELEGEIPKIKQYAKGNPGLGDCVNRAKAMLDVKETAEKAELSAKLEWTSLAAFSANLTRQRELPEVSRKGEVTLETHRSGEATKKPGKDCNNQKQSWRRNPVDLLAPSSWIYPTHSAVPIVGRKSRHRNLAGGGFELAP
jgi:hypothetical protein